MSEAAGEKPPLAAAEAGARQLVQGVFGFVFAPVLAVLAVAGLFGLVSMPWIPMNGKVAAGLLAIATGVSQATYAVPIYAWAQRRGASGFAAGLRAGAFTVVLVNALILAMAVMFPSFED